MPPNVPSAPALPDASVVRKSWADIQDECRRLALRTLARIDRDRPLLLMGVGAAGAIVALSVARLLERLAVAVVMAEDCAAWGGGTDQYLVVAAHAGDGRALQPYADRYYATDALYRHRHSPGHLAPDAAVAGLVLYPWERSCPQSGGPMPASWFIRLPFHFHTMWRPEDAPVEEPMRRQPWTGWVLLTAPQGLDDAGRAVDPALLARITQALAAAMNDQPLDGPSTPELVALRVADVAANALAGAESQVLAVEIQDEQDVRYQATIVPTR